MNATLKLLITLLAVALLAACAGAGQKARAAEEAARIATFSLPEGYQPELALELAGYSIVSYNPGDGHSHLYLVQSPSGEDVSQEKLEALLRQSKPGQTSGSARMVVVETRSVTIRGQESTLVISEGTNHDGETYRQATAGFPGKGGPALLVIEEPLSRWDDARVERLIASIE